MSQIIHFMISHVLSYVNLQIPLSSRCLKLALELHVAAQSPSVGALCLFYKRFRNPFQSLQLLNISNILRPLPLVTTEHCLHSTLSFSGTGHDVSSFE
jgi:hypothetical protein